MAKSSHHGRRGLFLIYLHGGDVCLVALFNAGGVLLVCFHDYIIASIMPVLISSRLDTNIVRGFS